MLLSGLAGAQEPRDRLFRDVTLGSGMHYQQWERDGQSRIGELSIPLVLIWPVARKLSVDMVSGSGFASLGDDSGSLSGLTDTKVRASYIVGQERALLTLGVSTPTGKTGLTGEQRAVSNSLSQAALGFRTANFGQGLDFNAGLAMAGKVGEFVVGAGVGFLLKGEFTPRSEEEAKYKPGSELSLTLGLDRKVMDGDGLLTLDAVYTIYGEDEKDGVPAFQAGDKLLIQGVGRFHTGSWEWRINFAERLRADSKRFDEGVESAFANGNQFEAGLSLAKRTSADMWLRLLGGAKLYVANAYDRGEATVVSAGPGFRYRFAPGRYIDLYAKYGTGTLDGDSASGIDIGGGIWFRL